MKNKYLNIFLASLALFGVSSCNEDAWSDANNNGQGELNLGALDIKINNSEKVVTKSRANDNVDNFIVTVSDANGKTVGEWTYGEMPEVLTLPVGQNYKIEVESHKIQQAEFDMPYYSGEQTFDISKGKITKVENIVAKFNSLRVSIIFDDSLKSKLGNDAKVVVKGSNNSELEFTPQETRSGYFALDGATTFAAHFSGTVDGVMTEESTPFKNVSKGEHHKLTYKIKNGPEIPEQSGSVEIPEESGIIIDVEYSQEESINGDIIIEEDPLDPSDRPGKEEKPEDPNQPGDDEPGEETNAIAFEAYDSPNLKLREINVITEATVDDFGNAIVRILSENGIQSFDVKIESTSDDPAFIGALEAMEMISFSLTDPTETAEENLNALELPSKDQVRNQNQVDFNITAFVPILINFPGIHTFTMIVKDNGLDKLDGDKNILKLQFEVK